ncbi:ankycorbin-like [Ptychodera flava]|uniref:ankycorbin-like n=1 Tax=Ptychodera flava TaxID=63121 RepID=UPI00396A6E89
MAGRLFDAVSEVRFPEVRLLLDLGVNVNCKNSLGQTPVVRTLFIEDEKNRDKMFRYLVRRGADLLEEDNNGKTVFLYACQRGRTRQVHRILNAVGAGSVNLNGRDADGNTPLLYAVKTNNMDLVRLLVQLLKYYHLSVDVTDPDGCTPLIHARKLELTNIGDFLCKEGKANPYIADNREHWNAHEWAEYAKEKREVDEKERKRIHNLIFPPVTKIRKKPQKARIIRPNNGLKSSPPLSLKDADSDVTSYSAPEVLSGMSTARSSMSSFGSHLRRSSVTSLPLITDKRPLNKSVDSALTLLEMASIQGDHIEHVDHFVSSQPDTSKLRAQYNQHHHNNHHNHHHFGGQGHVTLLNNLFSAYAEQQTESFRKVAKIVKPKTPPRPSLGKKKVSSLAIVFGRDKQHDRVQRMALRKGKRGKGGEKDFRGEQRSKRSREARKQNDGRLGNGFETTLDIISEDTEETITRDNRRRKKISATFENHNSQVTRPKAIVAQSH